MKERKTKIQSQTRFYKVVHKPIIKHLNTLKITGLVYEVMRSKIFVLESVYELSNQFMGVHYVLLKRTHLVVTREFTCKYEP